jgi:hypothetical protein
VRGRPLHHIDMNALSFDNIGLNDEICCSRLVWSCRRRRMTGLTRDLSPPRII